MLKPTRRRHAALFIVLAVLVIGATVGVFLYLRQEQVLEEEDAALPAEPEAPPDLQRLRDAYTAGLQAIEQKDGATAVRHLSSFDFGSRAVEEYRLYHLARAYEMSNNAQLSRAIYRTLWTRTPKLIHGDAAALELGNLYSAAGDLRRAEEVYASIPSRSDVPATEAQARWLAVQSRLGSGNVSGALFAARNIIINNPRSDQTKDALAVARSILALPDTTMIPLTPTERLTRIEALRNSGDPQTALEELDQLAAVAPSSLANEVRLQRGLALHQLRRFEDSNKTLEPLTSGVYKTAIPALITLSRNYRILASAIDPTVIKNVKEKKQVGTVKVRVGKGKKRRTVTKPKFQTVTKQVKLVDLAKKSKRDEYERLTSERLKDLLQLPATDDQKLEALVTLMARAQAKNQDEYLMELVPQAVKLDPLLDPALQYFWDRGWTAYNRGDLETARRLFRFLGNTYAHNTNVRRQSEYWHARTIERLGQKEDAAATYRKLANAPYADLYAMHSLARGATRQPNTTNPLEVKRADWAEIAEKQMPAELRLAYELTALSDMKDARLEIQRNTTRQNVQFAEALLADLYHSRGELVLMYRSIRRAFPKLATVEQDEVPAYFFRMYYPVKYEDAIDKYSKENGVDPHLVMGLILQESFYNPKAKSRVGATGLMQLMPPTAKELAGQLRIPFALSRLENPEVNVRLGTRHLRMLVTLFDGNTHLAVASYNGGQGNVMKWRRAAPRKPMDEFLESIPFPETRNYVKRVQMLKSSYERLTL